MLARENRRPRAASGRAARGRAVSASFAASAARGPLIRSGRSGPVMSVPMRLSVSPLEHRDPRPAA
jgi:hypothetical protein